MSARRPGRDPRLVAIVLRLCDRLRPLYELAAVDYPKLRELVRVKLVLDHRRRTGAALGFLQNAGFSFMLAIYALFGLLLGGLALLVEDPFLYMTLVQSLSMLLLCMPLLVDLSPVMLDTTDLDVIAPRPVSDRTLFAARLTHIGLYVGMIVVCLGVGPALVGATRFAAWIYLPAFALIAVLAAVVTVAGVFLLFLIGLRSLDVSRFRDALVYVQVGAFVVFYFGTQLGPHLARKWGLLDWIAGKGDLALLYPPAHFGGLLRFVLGDGRAGDVRLAAAAVAFPALLVGAVLLLAKRGFIARLAAMDKGGVPRRGPRRRGLTGRVSGWVTRPGVERAGYFFFLAEAASERGYKLRTLPLLIVGFAPFALVFLIPDSADDLPSAGKVLPYLPYVLLFALTGLWEGSRFSDNHEGRWVLDGLERAQRTEFVRGGIKSILVRFVFLPLGLYMPVCLLLSDVGHLPDAFFAAGAVLSAAFLAMPFFARFVPFTEEYTFSRAQSNMGLGILSGLFLLAVVGLHAGLSAVPYAMPVAALVVPVAAYRLARRFERHPLRLPVLPADR